VPTVGLFFLSMLPALAETTNIPPVSSQLPDAGLSALRVLGALVLVLGVFFGGVWLFRNWQRLGLRRGLTARLNVLEARPLGQRQALYVVAYERQRFLVASSATGVSLLSHLPDADETTPLGPTAPPPTTFRALLNHALFSK
jgi:flagellar biogenesis protein FliO